MTRTPDAVHQALHEEVTAAEAAASPRAREVLLAATEASPRSCARPGPSSPNVQRYRRDAEQVVDGRPFPRHSDDHQGAAGGQTVLACTAADVLLSGEPRDEAWARHRTV